MKSIIKFFLSPKKLSYYTADKIQAVINESGKSEIIKKYATIADQITDIQKFVTETLSDGNINEIEKEMIKEKLIPVFDSIFSFL